MCVWVCLSGCWLCLWCPVGLLDDPSAAAAYEVVFGADLPPVGYATYALLLDTNSSSSSDTHSVDNSIDTAHTIFSDVGGDPARPAAAAAAGQAAAAAAAGAAAAAAAAAAGAGGGPSAHSLVSNGVLNVTLHAITGRLVSVGAADGSWVMQLTQEIMWYKSRTGIEPGTSSEPEPKGSTVSSAPGHHSPSSKSKDSKCSGVDPKQGTATDGIGCGGGEEGGGAKDGGQSSGAYIFRPAGDAPVSVHYM